MLLCLAAVAAAEDLPADERTVAVLPLENSSGDPKSDYLGKIAEALLMYDLSSREDIELVSRSELDAVLQEQRLALSGLVEGSEELREVGGLAGADYLLKGEYVHLGDDILFIMRLISVESGEVSVVRERGTDENTVHRIAGRLVDELTGSTVSFETDAGRRSIISMKNEEPGSLAVFSHLIDAQIFLDEEFVGYSTGDPTEPYLIEDVRPGPHSVRTHLSRNFGVVDLPEVEFRDWQTEVFVRPQRRTVVRDESRHFNEILYEMQWLVREEYSFGSPVELLGFEEVQPFEFVDRDGRRRTGSVTVSTEDDGRSARLVIDLVLDGRSSQMEIFVPEEAGAERGKTSLSLVDLEGEVEYRYGSYDISLELTRNDVYQGLHREEYR
jgi:TolB-like protein